MTYAAWCGVGSYNAFVRRTVGGIFSLLFFSLFIAKAAGAQPVDGEVLRAIKEEGLERSRAMEIVSWLADVYGPRVTGTPAIEAAREWATETLQSWGLDKVEDERFPFGKGWSLIRFHAHMIEPQVMPIIGYPRLWSSSTAGTVIAEVVRVDIRSPDDFPRYRGRLRGKIVLPQPARDVPMLEGDLVLRMDEVLLNAAGNQLSSNASTSGTGRSSASSIRKQIGEFYIDEGVAAIIDRGSDSVIVSGAPSGSNLEWPTQRTDGGTVFVGQTGSPVERSGQSVPAVTIAVEHYNRIIRVLEKMITVRIELNVETRFHDELRPNGFNLVAEIPGSDLATEVVMLGAHFDSTHAATGATDNAAGVAAMMEAMRILAAIEAKPRRTIRLGLWGGEEQGLLGSRAYVQKHYADRRTMQFMASHQNISAYFNLDNGAGRIRGIWSQGNHLAGDIFREWISTLTDLGVTTVGMRSTRGTDHVSFDEVGLPGFQFMQDRLEYNSRTHHSNMDFYDRVQREDLEQMAVVAAIFAYRAAVRDERLPRKQ